MASVVAVFDVYSYHGYRCCACVCRKISGKCTVNLSVPDCNETHTVSMSLCSVIIRYRLKLLSKYRRHSKLWLFEQGRSLGCHFSSQFLCSPLLSSVIIQKLYSLTCSLKHCSLSGFSSRGAAKVSDHIDTLTLL